MFDQTRGILICQFRNVQMPHLYCMLICLLLSEKTMLTLSLTTEESGTLFKKIKLGIPLGVPTHRLRTTALEHGIIWHLGYRFNSWHTCTRQRKQAFVTAAINVELLIAWVKICVKCAFSTRRSRRSLCLAVLPCVQSVIWSKKVGAPSTLTTSRISGTEVEVG